MSGKIDSPIFPVVSWRTGVGGLGGDSQVAFLEIGYAKTFGETRAALPGRPAPHTVPLGMTARQCRDLAADLLAAANKIDAGSARQ